MLTDSNRRVCRLSLLSMQIDDDDDDDDGDDDDGDARGKSNPKTAGGIIVPLRAAFSFCVS